MVEASEQAEARRRYHREYFRRRYASDSEFRERAKASSRSGSKSQLARRKRRYHIDPEYRERVLERGRGKKRTLTAEQRQARSSRARARHADPIERIKLNFSQMKCKEKYRLRYAVRSARNRSRVAGIDCDEQFLHELAESSPSHCLCCKHELDYKVGTRPGSRPKNLAPSFDRIDVKYGYVRGNVAVICWRCNALKRDGSLAEMEQIVAYMKEHFQCDGNGQPPS